MLTWAQFGLEVDHIHKKGKIHKASSNVGTVVKEVRGMHYRLVCTLCYTICIPLISCALIMVSCTDYRRPMKPFFIDIPKFLANWADRPNKFWGIFGLTFSPHVGSISII